MGPVSKASLSRKALAVVALVFGLTMAAVAVSSAYRTDDNMTRQFESRGVAIATSLAGSGTDTLLFGDVATVQSTIDQFLDIDGVGYMLVVDADGAVLAHTFVPTVPPELRTLHTPPEGTTVQEVRVEGMGDFIDVSAPILAGEMGTVHVGMKRELIRAAVWHAVTRQLAVLGGTFLFSLLAASWLMKRIVKPLRSLTDAATTLAHAETLTDAAAAAGPGAGMLSVSRRADEVGQLAHAFRFLVDQVAAREQELRTAHGDLDRRVRERTGELTVANERLQQEIAERSRAEEELRQTAMELARSNADLEQFAYIASHDLQEPLRKVQAFGDMLVAKYRSTLGEEGQDYLQRMQNAARRMQALINDLLTYSRVTTKGRRFEEVDLGRLVREVLSDLEARIRQTGGRVEVGELPSLAADPTQLRQLLQNLLGNALKFHRPGEPPVVHVEGRVLCDGAGPEQSGSRPVCEIAVRDNGIGFDEKYLGRLFAPFQRLHGRGEYEGTGIGLAICRKIVERHGGAITARSSPGQGSAFLVTLPLRPPKTEDRRQRTEDRIQ
jgi:signal transduction histidine kinase